MLNWKVYLFSIHRARKYEDGNQNQTERDEKKTRSAQYSDSRDRIKNSANMA